MTTTRLSSILSDVSTHIEALTPATAPTILFHFAVEPWEPSAAQGSDYDRKCWWQYVGHSPGEWFEHIASRDVEADVDLVVGYRPDAVRRALDLETKLSQDIEQLMQLFDDPTFHHDALAIRVLAARVENRAASALTMRMTIRVHYSLAFRI